jgi:hypothetical protein
MTSLLLAGEILCFLCAGLLLLILKFKQKVLIENLCTIIT